MMGTKSGTLNQKWIERIKIDHDLLIKGNDPKMDSDLGSIFSTGPQGSTPT